MQDVIVNDLAEAFAKVFNRLDDRLANIERLLIENGIPATEFESEQFLSLKQAAEFLDIFENRLRSMVTWGEIPFYETKAGTYFSTKDLKEWIKSGGRKKTRAERKVEVENSIPTEQRQQEYRQAKALKEQGKTNDHIARSLKYDSKEDVMQLFAEAKKHGYAKV